MTYTTPFISSLAAVVTLLLTCPAWSQENTADAVFALQQKVLATKISIDVESMPLSKLAETLEQKSGIPVRIDERSLEDIGVPMNTAVSASFQDTSLHSVLKWSLRGVEMVYFLEPDGIVLGTEDEAERHLQARFYAVPELIGKPKRDFDSLIDVTNDCLDQDSWERLGGDASIAPFHDGVMIRQTTQRHRLVAAMYEELVQAKGMTADAYRHDSALVTLLPEETASLRAKLQSDQLEWGASDMPLRKAVKELRTKTNVNLHIDERALYEEGLGLDESVSLRPRERSLARTLDLLLEPLDLSWYVADDVVVITSLHEMYEAVEVRIYPVRDLIWRGLDTQAPDLKERLASYLPRLRRHPLLYWDNPFPILLPSPILQSIPADDQLREMLTTTIEPESWAVLGGPAEAMFFPQADCLIVAQTAKQHAKIADALAQLRKHYQPLSLEEFLKSIERENAEIVTASYPVAHTFRETPEEREQGLRQVFQQIQYRVEPGSWNMRDVHLTYADGRVVIRHTRAAQRQVLALLIEAGVVRPKSTGHFCNGASTGSFQELERSQPPEPPSSDVPPVPQADPVDSPTAPISSEDPFG